MKLEYLIYILATTCTSFPCLKHIFKALIWAIYTLYLANNLAITVATFLGMDYITAMSINNYILINQKSVVRNEMLFMSIAKLF